MIKTYLKSIEVNIIILTILLYLFRATIPVLKFPFLLLFFGLIVYSIIRYRAQLFVIFVQFFRDFYLIILLLIIFIISYFLSNKLYLVIFKDIINAVVLIALFFLLTVFTASLNDLSKFYRSIIRFIIFFSLFISVLLIFSFLNVFQDGNDISSDMFSSYSLIGSVSLDYNFALIPVFFGMIGVFYFLIDPGSLSEKGFYNLALIIYSLTVFLSGSRRGLMTLACIIIILLIIQFYLFFNKDSILKNLGSNLKWFLISIVTLIFLSWGFAFHTSYSFKNKALAFIGSKNIVSTKTKVALAVYRYTSIINKDISYYEVYDQIWFHGFDKALDPDNGLGLSMYKTIFPLTGKNVNIVPSGSVGYLMDRSRNVYTRDGNAYAYTLIGAGKVEQGDIVLASVYCYVSKDFNGGGVKICSEGSADGNNVTYYDVLDSSFNIQYSSRKNFNYFNLNSNLLYRFNKTDLKFPFFRKLSTKDTLNENSIYDKTVYFPSERKNLFSNGDFSCGTLYWREGADSTHHEIIETPFGKGIRITRTDGDGGSWSLYYDGRPIIYYAGHKYKISFNFKIEKGNTLPFNIGWWINNEVQGSSSFALPLTIKNIDDNWKEATSIYKFKETYFNLPTFLNSLQDYSTVDIANVELEDLDRIDSLPAFVDQIVEMKQEKKGVWQKLTLKANCNKGIAPVYLYISKRGVTDFTSLKGYVLFAYPEYKIVSKKETISTSLNTSFNSIVADSSSKSVTEFENKHFLGFPLIQQYGTKKLQAGIFASGLPFLTYLIPNRIEKDPIRKWASKLISEDTTYYGYKKNLDVATISNKFFGNRLMRWQFAWQIYSQEYNWRQKIFGGGFNFLNWFGYYFMKDKSLSDYPHNPFLSVLLYSGIFGLIIYLFFVYKAIYYYAKYLREYKILSIFFLITFFFSFFSAGSPFDPPIMGFFVVLPFFFQSFHKRKLQD